MEQPEISLLQQLAGRELSAVVFVRDYLQLQFDGPNITPRLNLYVWPRITQVSVVVSYGESGYRDALCAQIGRLVEKVSRCDARICLFLHGDTLLDVSLRPADCRGPEAIEFQGGEDGEWGVW